VGESILIASCLFGCYKTSKAAPKNYLAFQLIFLAIASAAVLGILNYASIEKQHSSYYHPLVSSIVSNRIIPVLLPFAVYQAINLGPVTISDSVGQLILGACIGFVALTTLNPTIIYSLGLPSALTNLDGSLLAMLFCLLYALIWGMLIKGAERIRCTNMVAAVVVFAVADAVLKNNLVSHIPDLSRFADTVDVFHVLLSFAMVLVSNVAGGYNW